MLSFPIDKLPNRAYNIYTGCIVQTLEVIKCVAARIKIARIKGESEYNKLKCSSGHFDFPQLLLGDLLFCYLLATILPHQVPPQVACFLSLLTNCKIGHKIFMKWVPLRWK